MEIINLSSYALTDSDKQWLSKGLSFCPHINIDHFEVIKDVDIFVRNLLLKLIYYKEDLKDDKVSLLENYSKTDFQMLKTLNKLLAEGGPPDLIDSVDLEGILSG